MSLLLLQDGTSYLLLQDGSDRLALQDGAAATELDSFAVILDAYYETGFTRNYRTGQS